MPKELTHDPRECNESGNRSLTHKGKKQVCGDLIMFNDYHDIITVDELCEMLRIGKHSAYTLLAN